MEKHENPPLQAEMPNVCIICGQMSSEGIAICNEFICEKCEAEIVQTDVKDEKYPFFIHQMRVLWYAKDISI